MSFELQILEEAQEELDGAVAWYDEQRPGLGDEFLATIDGVLNRICATPTLYAVVEEGVRFAYVPRFPYSVIYQEDENQVLVISIFHTSRDPKAWKSRDY